MKLVVTGVNGQIGWELMRSLAPLGVVVGLDREGLDLSRPASIGPLIEALEPDVIVNAAAYTAVDRAEQEERLATRINGEAVGFMAEAARRAGALLIHYSTDYVFDGAKSEAYTESDAVAPLNAYGRSKLEGERMIQASGCAALIFRTTWVYGSRGNNFLQTILKLAKERDTLSIVVDQHGAPTTARFLADATAQVIRTVQHEREYGDFESGLYHLTADGCTTWHEFACAIVQWTRDNAPGRRLEVKTIDAIRSDQYPTAARRPRNSMLDNQRFVDRFKLHRPDWREGMKTTLQDVLLR